MKTLTQIIGDRIIRAAAEQADLNASCRILQDAMGVTEGIRLTLSSVVLMRHPDINGGDWTSRRGGMAPAPGPLS